MAVILCYCDESGKQGDHPVVTFSGLCLAQPKLAAFDDAWNTLLRQYEIASLHMARASRLSEKHGPKMPRGQTASERIKALVPNSQGGAWSEVVTVLMRAPSFGDETRTVSPSL